MTKEKTEHEKKIDEIKETLNIYVPVTPLSSETIEKLKETLKELEKKKE